MSTRWDLFCATCNASLGIEHTGRQNDLAEFLSAGGLKRIAALEPLSHAIDTVRLDCIGGDYDLVGFCVAHQDHAVVVQSEYGERDGDCMVHFPCSKCRIHQRCALARGHDGEHSADRPPPEVK